MGAPKNKQKYTYQDYLSWDDGKRWELFHGVPYELVFGDDPENMTPAPNRKHQKVSGNLFRLIGNYLVGKSCEVFAAPFDVCLSKEENDDTVIQPDLSIFCDKSKLDNHGARGAPDWVIEILSPSTLKRDLSIKQALYQEYGVKEYWIVDPDKHSILVYNLQKDGYFHFIEEFKEGNIAPALFPDLSIDLAEVFKD